MEESVSGVSDGWSNFPSPLLKYVLNYTCLCRLMNATPMDPPTPFATLTDHTLAITSIAVGLGTFPNCRILTASLDATCKVRPINLVHLLSERN